MSDSLEADISICLITQPQRGEITGQPQLTLRRKGECGALKNPKLTIMHI